MLSSSSSFRRYSIYTLEYTVLYQYLLSADIPEDCVPNFSELQVSHREDAFQLLYDQCHWKCHPSLRELWDVCDYFMNLSEGWILEGCGNHSRRSTNQLVSTSLVEYQGKAQENCSGEVILKFPSEEERTWDHCSKEENFEVRTEASPRDWTAYISKGHYSSRLRCTAFWQMPNGKSYYNWAVSVFM